MTAANKNAAEIKVWCARAIKTVLAEVGAEFERASGHKLNVTTDPGLQDAYLKRTRPARRSTSGTDNTSMAEDRMPQH